MNACDKVALRRTILECTGLDLRKIQSGSKLRKAAAYLADELEQQAAEAESPAAPEVTQ